MKQIFTVLFVFVWSCCMAQELTADSPAIEPSLLEQVMQAAIAGLAAMLGLFIKNALPLLNAWLKQIMHFRGAAVVADALTQALAELSEEVRKALLDGKLTDAERTEIKLRANSIAKEKLKNLSGFYKADLHKWVDEQLDVLLGKLLSRT